MGRPQAPERHSWGGSWASLVPKPDEDKNGAQCPLCGTLSWDLEQRLTNHPSYRNDPLTRVSPQGWGSPIWGHQKLSEGEKGTLSGWEEPWSQQGHPVRATMA